MKKIHLLCFMLYTLSGFTQDKNMEQIIDQAYEMFNGNDYNGAVGLLNRTINKMPDSCDLYLVRGIFMNSLKRFDEAIEDYTTALEKTEDHAKRSVILSNRGGARNMDHEGAYKDLMMAIEADSTNINALNNLSIVCGRTDRTEESIKHLKQIVRVNKDYLPGYINLGYVYQKREEHKLAMPYFDQAVKLDPNAPFAYSNRSFSKLKLGDIKGAYKDINKSLKLHPGNSYAYKIRAMIHVHENKIDEACLDLNTAEEMYYTKEYGNEVLELIEKHCK